MKFERIMRSKKRWRLRFAKATFNHLISRVVHKRFLIDEEAMGALRRMMRSQAAFCGMEVLTYCFLGNHFHIFVRVDPEDPPKAADAALLARFRALYGTKRSPSLGVDAEGLEAALKRNDEAAEALRRRLRARMGDASVFMRELKTRFTLWYNARHGTVGTFWAERYRSVVVEERSHAARLVAAYIDLNPVRAGLVADPRKYRFCGYGEACSGGAAARAGIARIENAPVLTEALLARYRTRLLDQMPTPPRSEDGRKADKMRSVQEYGAPHLAKIGKEERQKAAASTGGGKVRAFTEGVVLGTIEWVAEVCRAGGALGLKRTRAPVVLPLGEGTEAVAAARHCSID